MIVLLIVTVGIVGAYKVVGSGKNLATSTESRIKAINIAREGLETMANIRDTNWIKFSSDFQGCFDSLNYDPGCIGTVGPAAWVSKMATGSYIALQDSTTRNWTLSGVTSPADPIADRANYLTQFPVYLDDQWLVTQSGASTTLCSDKVIVSCRTLFTRELKVTRPSNSVIQVSAIITWIDTSRSEPYRIEIPYTLQNWKAAYYSQPPTTLMNGSCGGSANICNAGSPSGYSAGACGGSQTWSCIGSGGGSTSSCSIANAACAVPLPTFNFYRSPASLSEGEYQTVWYSTTNATNITRSCPGYWIWHPDHTRTSFPLQQGNSALSWSDIYYTYFYQWSYTCTWTITGPGGTINYYDSFVINHPLPTISFYRYPTVMNPGDIQHTGYSTTNATSVTYYCYGNNSYSGSSGLQQGDYAVSWNDLYYWGWAGPYTCYWWVGWPGGTITYTDSFTTNAP